MNVTALIAVAHRRLALRRILMAIEKTPNLLDGFMANEIKRPLKIRMPIELAGLKTRMLRAEGQEKAIAKLGEGYDEVQGGIDELIGAHAEHLGDLRHYEGDLRRKIEGMIGSNGGDPLDGETGEDGLTGRSGAGQVISSETAKDETKTDAGDAQ